MAAFLAQEFIHIFGGVKHEPSPYKLVLKMSASQSAGISNVAYCCTFFGEI